MASLPRSLPPAGSPLLETVLIPVASSSDAETTWQASRPYLEGHVASVVLVHVIEKRHLGPDQASPTHRRTDSEAFLDVASAAFERAGIDVDSRIAYGTNVATTILQVAEETDASAIAFTPRGSSRWLRLISGDIGAALLRRSRRPVLIFPRGEPSTGLFRRVL